MTHMGALLNRAATEQALLDAWNDVRDRAYSKGEVSAEVQAFEGGAARRISEVSEELRRGIWQPSPAVQSKISKPSGGQRTLAVPPVEDRIVERSLLGVLDPVVDPELMPWSYGYRRGLGVDDAIRALIEARDAGHAWVMRADIEDCFDEIPRWPVLELLRKVCQDAEAVDLVRRIVNRHVIGRDSPRGNRQKGLNQGSPLSPMLANLYLNRFDRMMADKGWQVIRFADDFAVPATSRAAGELAIAEAREAAGELDLDLNLGKTEVVSFDDGVDFLGQTTTASTGAGAIDSAHPVETTVYVEHEGAFLRTRGERLVVSDGDETLARVNWRRVRQVVVLGRVGLSTPFLHRALERGVEVILADDGGELVGRFTPMERSTPGVRLEQYEAATSASASLRLARAMVQGKLANQRVMLMRLDNRMPEPILGPYATRMDQFRLDAGTASTREVLMGLEGAAARDYFRAFGDYLDPTWEWQGRVRRPPTDPMNAMLSFGYTLLTNEGMTAAEIAGLDPHLGFLHATHAGRPSLALDLIEEFRPVVVDSVVFALIGRGQVHPGDFENDPGGACRMSKPTRDVFVTAYEKRMLQLVTHRESGRRVSYRTALHLQAKLLARSLDGDEVYTPILWK
mgnify:CR=1 FL=1